MSYTIPISHSNDSSFEPWVEDLHPFSKTEVYSLKQKEVVASQMWIKLCVLESKSLR